MNQTNIPCWNTYFINMLENISLRSKDPNTHTACIIVGPDMNIRSTGYNSFPRGIDDTNISRYERPEKYFWIEHADRNAIFAAAKCGTPLDGCKMYLTGLPCCDCSRAIIQVGIIEVIYDYFRHEAWEKTTPKYVPDFERVKIMLQEAGVKLTPWKNV